MSTESGEVQNKIFKVTSSGALLEVSSLDQSGNAVTVSENPIAIVPAGSAYYLFCFGIDMINISDAYLVRRSDGAAFQVPGGYLPMPATYIFKNAALAQADSTGSIYWVHFEGSKSSITKISTTDPSNLTAQSISPDSDTAQALLVDSSGNVLYNYSLSDGSTGYRILKANGGLWNLPTAAGSCFLDLNGNFEYVDGLYSGPPALYTVTIAGDGSVTKNLTSTLSSASWSCYGGSGTYFFSLNDEQYAVESLGTLGSFITRMFSKTGNTIGNVAQSPLSTCVCAGASSSALYLAGNDSSGSPRLVKYSPPDSFVDALPVGEYNVLSMDVRADGEVLFNALRMSDGKKVVGTLSAAGSLNIVDDSYNATVVSLVQVN